MALKKLLVIDDDASLRRLLSRSLAEFGFAIEGREATQAGLDRLFLGGVDAVLLDVMLGMENGWETLRLIREKSAVPVLLMTGALVDDEVARDARLLGAQGVVKKPFELPELAARLKELTG